MAKANSAARSLIQVSKTQGWDATRIWNHETKKYEESIAGWDHPREPMAEGLGNIPTNDPPKEFYGTSPNSIDPTGGPKMTEKTLFNHPDTSREARVSGKPKMTLSDPDPGI